MKYTVFTDLGHRVVFDSEQETLFDFITLLCFCGECSSEWASKQLHISVEEVDKEVKNIIDTHEYVGANCLQWKEEAERKRFHDLLGDIEIDL